jgi:drug/metabolite transporter (DMT)-like permease
MKGKYYLSVVIGAALWGTISIFVKGLYELGFTALQIASLRIFSASLILLGYSLLTNRSLLKIDLKDIPWFIGTGVISLVFFSWCYFFTIAESSVSMAVILLYTAPAMVTVLSRIFFKELLTLKKIISLMLAFIGMVIVTGVYLPGQMNITIIGLMTGLGSGVGYALYSIIGKPILKKYNPLTVTNYTLFVAAIVLVPVLLRIPNPQLLLESSIIMSVLGLGLFPTALAYIFYTKGLVHLEASKASITATVEPVVGTLLGVFVFGDIISGFQWIGIGLILLSVVVVNLADKRSVNYPNNIE